MTEPTIKGWSVRQLEYCRSFYLSYPLLIGPGNSNAVRSKSESTLAGMREHIANAAPAESPGSPPADANSETVRRKMVASAATLPIQDAVCVQKFLMELGKGFAFVARQERILPH
ncbi:MAG: hypothetical protein EXR29_08740 [Betaproteobacteria bacterium]|nr:hypothetical protein [Betaproteobacteria bacterium]